MVASAIGWSQFGGGGEPRPWVKPADVDGQLVRLSYVDSPCQDSADIDVDESPDEVVVTVRTRTWALSCSEADELYRFEVRLSSRGARRHQHARHRPQVAGRRSRNRPAGQSRAGTMTR